MLFRGVLIVVLGGASCVACAAPEQSRAAPAAAQAAPVRVQVRQVERKEMTRSITLPASVEAFEQARLYAKVSGYLKTITVDIGDRVQRDQLIATLEVPEMRSERAAAEARLAEARAQAVKAQADFALQKTLFRRTRALRKRKAVTENDLDEARAKHAVAQAALQLARARVKSAQAELAKLETLMAYAGIKAPFAGIVTQRFADPGALIQAATDRVDVTPIVTVARVDRMRTFVDIPEREVPFIGTDDPATLVPSALIDHTFEGRVTRFAGALNPATRTMRTEVDFPNPDGRLYPGMYGSLTIGLETHPNAVSVPSGAVTTQKKGQPYVYVVVNGVARRKFVRTGVDDGIRTEIVSGLDGTEQCIVSASGSIDDGTRVEVTQAHRAGGRS